MWTRFAEDLRCCMCRKSLELFPIEKRQSILKREFLSQGEKYNISAERLCSSIDSGLLICQECNIWFPIIYGLPILLPYTTESHKEFIAVHGNSIRKLGTKFRSPNLPPVIGEQFVLRSFSKEWLDYSYDGVIWEWSYDDRKALFLAEIGWEPVSPSPCRFIEIGCGLGLVTAFSVEYFQGEAVGVDLSLAAMRAANRYKDHPFLHFVQASLWQLPFALEAFDLVYSHGVLHHTHDTRKAFQNIASLCKSGGRVYIWVYGRNDTKVNLLRQFAYMIEKVARPLFARMPTRVANIAITPIALVYIMVNWGQRKTGSKRKAYNYRRALHAARDRFTPFFAFRTDPETVATWFYETGFKDLHLVEKMEGPASARDALHFNIGLRGIKHE